MEVIRGVEPHVSHEIERCTFVLEDFQELVWEGKPGDTFRAALRSVLPEQLFLAVRSLTKGEVLDECQVRMDDATFCGTFNVYFRQISIVVEMVEPVGIYNVHPLLCFRHAYLFVQHEKEWPCCSFVVRCNNQVPDENVPLHFFWNHALHVHQIGLKGGGRDADVKQWLANMLTAKGVPEGRVPDRTMFIIQKVGFVNHG